MLLEVKTFVRILDRRSISTSTFQPLLLQRWGFSFLFLCVVVFFIGCGSSSPRFGNGETAKKKSSEKKKGEIRFSSKEAEEEKKEDDRKVDVKDADRRFSSEKKKIGPKKGVVEKPEQNIPSTPVKFEDQRMMDIILAWMGTPYEYGGSSKSGIDCSGFTKIIFKESAEIEIPRSTEEQVKLGTSIEKDQLKFGDLIFFNTTGKDPSHVGIYIGDDMFAHASVSGGVTLSSMYSSYYKKRYTQARRVLE